MFVRYVIQLGTINRRNEIVDRKGLERDLKALKNIGVDGVMVDCWWGLVERNDPQKYNWSGYQDLFSLVRELKLKLQVPMASFLSLIRRVYSM
jgi:beta-amylase